MAKCLTHVFLESLVMTIFCFRYAVSVIWELDKKYEVVDVWYGKTIIRSQYKLFYEVVIEIIM